MPGAVKQCADTVVIADCSCFGFLKHLPPSSSVAQLWPHFQTFFLIDFGPMCQSAPSLIMAYGIHWFDWCQGDEFWEGGMTYTSQPSPSQCIQPARRGAAAPWSAGCFFCFYVKHLRQTGSMWAMTFLLSTEVQTVERNCIATMSWCRRRSCQRWSGCQRHSQNFVKDKSVYTLMKVPKLTPEYKEYQHYASGALSDFQGRTSQCRRVRVASSLECQDRCTVDASCDCAVWAVDGTSRCWTMTGCQTSHFRFDPIYSTFLKNNAKRVHVEMTTTAARLHESEDSGDFDFPGSEPAIRMCPVRSWIGLVMIRWFSIVESRMIGSFRIL
eukprot:s469_g50.t1